MRITVIGDGAMATVCSLLLAGKGQVVTMWVRLEEDLRAYAAARENVRYLRGYQFPESLRLTGDGAEAFAGCELIVCAVPTQFIRGTLGRLAGQVPRGVAVVSVAKGIEVETLLRPTQIVRAVLGERPVAALSGPNIAAELAKGLPATAVVAGEEKQEARSKKQGAGSKKPEARSQKPEDGEGFAKRVQELFTTPCFRVYRNHDLLGVELAGATKNVIAVAAGILDGMQAGNNAKAALLTRGLVEITRLGVAMGAEAETFSGLAGLGDLVTTCVSPEGRNRTFGERVGRGEKVTAVLASMAGVVEGVPTTRAVLRLAAEHKVEMPISEMLHAVLFEGKAPAAGIRDLMGRELKREGGDG